MVGSRIDHPRPDRETEHKRHSSEHSDRCAKHEAQFADTPLDGYFGVVSQVRFGIVRRRGVGTEPRTSNPLFYGTESGLCRVPGGRRLDDVTDLLESNFSDIDGLRFKVT